MCGIFGGSSELLNKDVAKLLTHRGPDQSGQVLVKSREGTPFLLGQNRLNIVCKENVPTPIQKGGAVIAFNGEIYNWVQIRAELETKGYTFETRTDTEVVLCAYLEWGPACLHRFNGMFALAIWHEEKLFLARDRMGKKPLFYTHTSKGFAFCSEIKGFADLDFAEVPMCQMLEFYFNEHTPFRNVKSVRAGSYLIYTPANNDVAHATWWTFPEYTNEIDDDKQAVELFLEVFTDACKIRKVADVPVTIFLSGGIDSSLVQSILRLDVSYTVQFTEFEETINERQYVVEFGSRWGFEPRIVVPTREDFFATFSDLARFIEFPVGSFSVFPIYCLSRQARRDGYIVALSGEGADELFNGYYRNELLLKEAERIDADLRGPYHDLCRRYFGSDLERFCRMATRQGVSGVPMLLDFLRPMWRTDRTFGQNLSFVEATIFMQPLLVMADRLSMGSSLEVRNPFLDYRIIELSTKLTDRMKFRDGQGKWILRQALKTMVGEELAITKRKIKHGLPAPVNHWLFKSSAFDRKDWNHVLLGECLKQLVQAHEPTQ